MKEARNELNAKNLVKDASGTRPKPYELFIRYNGKVDS